MYHFGIIRKYTAALLDLFNKTEIQYKDSNDNLLTRNIPIRYAVREKSSLFDAVTTEQLLSGNYNVLPRASLSLISMIRTDERIMNKNMKINSTNTNGIINYTYNSVPYEFLYDLNFHCRGMNEASMIIEQIIPKFNPFISLDIYEIDGVSTPTRIPVKILDIGITTQDYEELSENIITVTFSFSLQGNFYPPIQTAEQIKEFKMYIDTISDVKNINDFTRKAIIGFDVNNSGNLENLTIAEDNIITYAPNIIDIVVDNFTIGTNLIHVIYDDKDSKLTELSFAWELLSPGIIQGNGTSASLTITESGSYEVRVTITDLEGNYTSLSKTFTV